MITFKQLEAIYWVTRAGGFAQAAQELHTTQSAISKRIQELERRFDTELFDRTSRNARLTPRGEQMFRLAQQLLLQRDEAVERFAQASVLETEIRIGVTELTAMTWLPRLAMAFQAQYPRVAIEPHIDISVNLREKLLADEVDLMIVPDVFRDHEDAQLNFEPIGKVELAWMCKPGMVARGTPIKLNELADHKLIIQGLTAGTGLVYKRWLRTMGVRPARLIVCNSLVGRIALTVSGLGLSYLPLKSMEPLLRAGTLDVVRATQPLPPSVYVAAYKRDRRSALVTSVTQLAIENCDFSSMVQMAY
ncbi:MAG TPA: LysR family transcriptional regulator [Bordetella sp.]